jgi:co-chaperonin GroES (HSP10)
MKIKSNVIPKKVLNFDKIHNNKETNIIDPTNLPASLSDRLPKPTGWRILVLPYQGTGKTKGGVLLADQTVETHQIATVCGYVLRVGPDAYADKTRFSEGPWCKEKDWVIFGRYSGSRLKIEGGEIRLLNDDEILATISNPEDILHLF